MSDPTQATPNPNAALTAAGLPDQFTMAELEAFLSADEIAALTKGGESILEMPEGVEVPAPEAPAATEEAPPAPQIQQPQPMQQMQVPDTSKAQADLTAAQANLTALQQEYDDGDLSQAEFQERHAAIVAAEVEARAQIKLAEQIQAQNRQQVVTRWNETVSAYQDKFPDLVTEQNFSLWDQSLRAVTASPAYQNLAMDRQIELAHRMMADHLEVTANTKIARPDSQAPKQEAQQPGPRKDARPEPIQTLAGIAAADPQSPDDGTFAAIDRMMTQDPEKAEAMLNRLTADQQQRYLETSA